MTTTETPYHTAHCLTATDLAGLVPGLPPALTLCSSQPHRVSGERSWYVQCGFESWHFPAGADDVASVTGWLRDHGYDATDDLPPDCWEYRRTA